MLVSATTFLHKLSTHAKLKPLQRTLASCIRRWHDEWISNLFSSIREESETYADILTPFENSAVTKVQGLMWLAALKADNDNTHHVCEILEKCLVRWEFNSIMARQSLQFLQVSGRDTNPRSPADSTIVHPPDSPRPHSPAQSPRPNKSARSSQSCAPGINRRFLDHNDDDHDHHDHHPFPPVNPPTFTVRATLSDTRHTFRSLPTTYVSRRSQGTSVSEIEVFCYRGVNPSDVDVVIKFITLPDSGSDINLVSETSSPHLKLQAVKSHVITIAGIGYSGRPLRSESKIKLSLHLR